jgi:SAM-dependent methyltransferase
MSEPVDAQKVWEERYAESDRIWSGRPNVRLVEVVADLPPGRALDLGCGEGGDAVWLAQRGWQVVAADIAGNALQRAAAAAGDLGARIDFVQHDLTKTFPEGSFDLVSAQFLHSPLDWDRAVLMRRAAAAVAPGGILLIVDHSAAPPWAQRMRDREFPSAQAVVEGMNLDPSQWERMRTESVQREAESPDGQPVTLTDNVIVLRRVR